jgi:hypothetical protein
MLKSGRPWPLLPILVLKKNQIVSEKFFFYYIIEILLYTYRKVFVTRLTNRAKNSYKLVCWISLCVPSRSERSAAQAL